MEIRFNRILSSLIQRATTVDTDLNRHNNRHRKTPGFLTPNDVFFERYKIKLGLYMYELKILPLIAIMIVIFSCQNETSEPQYYPSEGTYGTKIKVFSHGQDFLREYLYIHFMGVDDFVNADSIRSDTIYFTIPYGVESGDVVIYNWPDSIVLNDLQVNELGYDDIQIMWSNLNYDIDDYHATYTLVEYNTLSWSAEVRNDTVKIIGDYQTGDVRYEYHLLLQDFGNDKLPGLIDAYTILFNDYGGPGSIVNFPMTNGLVYIQDWKVDEKISGRVLSLPWEKNNYIFSCDLSDTDP